VESVLQRPLSGCASFKSVIRSGTKVVFCHLLLSGSSPNTLLWKVCGQPEAVIVVFGRLKTELFYPRDWQARTIEQFIQVVDSYIRWYNEKRIKISLGSLSPIEYRESLGITA
jgi:hypothetical protein